MEGVRKTYGWYQASVLLDCLLEGEQAAAADHERCRAAERSISLMCGMYADGVGILALREMKKDIFPVLRAERALCGRQEIEIVNQMLAYMEKRFFTVSEHLYGWPIDRIVHSKCAARVPEKYKTYTDQRLEDFLQPPTKLTRYN